MRFTCTVHIGIKYLRCLITLVEISILYMHKSFKGYFARLCLLCSFNSVHSVSLTFGMRHVARKSSNVGTKCIAPTYSYAIQLYTLPMTPILKSFLPFYKWSLH